MASSKDAAQAVADLAHHIKIIHKLPDEPTGEQLSEIIRTILRIQAEGQMPTEEDWADAVAAACPHVGKGVYGGVDQSNLNALLQNAVFVAQQQAAKPR